MHIVVEHRITDLDKFSSMDAAEVAGGGGPDFKEPSVPPAPGRVGSNLLVGSGLDRLAPGVARPATAGVTENTYIPIDDENAIGLPEAAAAGA